VSPGGRGALVSAGFAPGRAPGSARRDTLLGLGNPLLGDDGLGEHLLERLRAQWTLPPELEVVPGGNAGLDLLPVVEDARRLLLVDAIDAGLAPGRLVVLEDDAIPTALGRAVSPHHVGIAQVLALARVRERLPEQVVALGLQPGPPREEIRLGPEVSAALPRLLDAVVERLRGWGLPLRRIAEAG